MEISVIRARVLAVARSRLWIAVDGTLGASTRPRLRGLLAEWAEGDLEQLFLDVTGLRCTDGMTAENLRSLFAFAPHARFHLVGASADAQTLLATDPRFVLHTDLQSAWDAWT